MAQGDVSSGTARADVPEASIHAGSLTTVHALRDDRLDSKACRFVTQPSVWKSPQASDSEVAVLRCIRTCQLLDCTVAGALVLSPIQGTATLR